MRLPDVCALDLDGTLVDTVPDLCYCLDRALLEVDVEPVGEQRVREWVGDGLDALIRSALEWSSGSTVDDLLAERVRTSFLSLYAIHTSERSQIYTGVVPGLDFLAESGIRLACVTNKRARYTEKLLLELGLAERFVMVVSGDSLPTRKPSPGPLLHVANTLEASPSRCLLIGDSSNDVEAARAACFSIICVSYGYNRGQDIRRSQPDVVVESLAELPELFEKAC